MALLVASIPGRVFAFITVRRTTGPGTRVSNPSSPGTYNRRLLHEAQDNFAQN